MTPIRTLADIEAVEALPYETQIAARTTYGLIARAAQQFPERDAFIYLPSGDLDATPEHVTYAYLLRQIHRAANLFRSLGVGSQDSVAILAPNIPATHYALWGAQIAGRACAINYLLQPDHIAALLEASGAKVLMALGPNSELDVWGTVQKVLTLKPIPVIAIGIDGGALHEGMDFAIALQDQPDQLASMPVQAADISRIAVAYVTLKPGAQIEPARLLAIEVKLAEMLRGRDAPLQISAEDRVGLVVAVLQFATPANEGLRAALENQVRQALAAISVAIEIRFVT